MLREELEQKLDDILDKTLCAFQVADVFVPKTYVDWMITDAFQPYMEAVKDEADSKWVTALKPFNFTVDSPESLKVSVGILLEEAKLEEANRVTFMLGNVAREETLKQVEAAKKEERERILSILGNEYPSIST